MFIAQPPAVMTVPPAPAVERRVEVVSFTADVACAGRPIDRGGLLAPRAVVATRFGAVSPPAGPSTYRYTFEIDQQGRARTIRRVPTASPGYYIDASDLAPSLAASRFTGGARSDCSATYTATAAPIEAAAPALLYELASTANPPSTPELWEAVRPAGSNCARNPGRYLRLNMPAFERIAQPQGTASWVFLAYDVDRSGRPGNVRVLGSSGNAALDRAGVRALTDNRYAPGPGYRGCTYHFFHSGAAPGGSPELPPGTPADIADAPGCAVDPKSIAGLIGGGAYPVAFSRRRIEGVAAIGYDTAPWGAVGNVRVLASEPDESFGEAARASLSAGRVAESETGRRGCVQRVRFRLPVE